MRTSNSILTAALLVSISAAAQQATDSQAPTQSPATAAAQPAQPSQQVAPAPDQSSPRRHT